jgi:hypothetical protein
MASAASRAAAGVSAMTKETDPVRDEQRLERAVPLGRAEILRHEMGRQRTELFRCQVDPGEHGQHARHRLGLRHVHVRDARVRVG